MLRDDIAWIHSIAETSTADKGWEAATGLSLGPQMARVVHEGVALLGRQRPAQAKAVHLALEVQIAAARHTVKLLDDTKKLYGGIIADFERIGEDHGTAFTQGGDIAIATRDDRLFTTTRVASFQHIADLADRSQPGKRSYAYGFGNDIGKALPKLLRQFGYSLQPPKYLPLPEGSAPRVETLDHGNYCDTRFEREFPRSLKDVLTVVECSINACLVVFDGSADVFPGPVFRARFVAVAHALNALHEIRDRHPTLVGRTGFSALSEVIDAPRAGRLQSFRALRNRCMHYGIPSNLEGLREDQPAYGLVEATAEGFNFDEINRDVVAVLLALSDVLRGWKPSAE